MKFLNCIRWISNLALLLIISANCLGTTAKVIRVIDGDTFVVESGDRVRLIGINAPEIRDIFGIEARDHLIALVEGKEVTLEPDRINKDRDPYQRLLRYVILDTADINKQMIVDGYAFAYLKYRFCKEEEFKQAELSARRKSLGIWDNTINQEIAGKEKSAANQLAIFSPRIIVIGVLILLLFAIAIYSYLRK